MLLLAGLTATWCWAADLNSSRSCVYDLKQCHEIMKLRRTGVCIPSSDTQRRQEDDR